MKKILAAALLLPLVAFAQIHFEKGYIVNNEGKKTDCLIKNRTWGNNPETFEYKASGNAEVQTGTMADISEFSIDGKLKYVRATVPMERSTTNMGKQQRDAAYTLKPETHFFKLLFEASHSLYMYQESGILKFFDRNDKGEMAQLIYIQYVGANGDLRHYNYFQTQLLETFSCPGTNLGDLSKLSYTESGLTNHYKKAADCKNEKVAVRESKKARFHLRPFVGFKSLKFSGGGGSSSRPSVEATKGDFAYGLETELIFPSNGYRWSIFIGADYNKIDDEIDLPDGIGIEDNKAKIDYAAIQIAFGGRHYFYLTDDVKIFANGMFVTNLVKDKVTIDYSQNGFTGDLYAEKFSYNFAVGAGFSYKKFNAELRYYTPQKIFKYEDGKINKFMVTVNYAIF